ncbi:MAG: DUF6788 family protein [bacterium]
MSKEKCKSIGELMARRQELFDQLKLLTDMADGNLVKMFRRCGKPNCKCAKGQKHGPAWALLYKEKGHTKMVYIPADNLPNGLKECRRRLKMYVQFKEVYREILAINRQLFKLQLTADKKGGEGK